MLIFTEVLTFVRLSVYLIRRSLASLIVAKEVDGVAVGEGGMSVRTLNLFQSLSLTKEHRPW